MSGERKACRKGDLSRASLKKLVLGSLEFK
jgi:hypothetical protein